MHRHTAASAAPVLQDGVHQRTDLAQRQGRPLGEEADAAGVEVPAESEATAGPAVGGGGAAGQGDGLGATDADNVVAALVDCVVALGGLPDGVA